MRSKIKVLILSMVLGLIFQGCKKDDAFTEEVGETITENGNANGNGNNGNGNGNNGNGNGNGNGNNGMNVSNLDHDVVYEWTQLMLEIERYATGMRPNASARSFAYIYLASYETAVPGISNQSSNQQRLQGLEINYDELPDDINWEIALNTCFARSMDHFIYNTPTTADAQIDNLESQLEREYSSRTPDDEIEASKEWGTYVANQVIAYSQTDQAAEAQILDPQPHSYDPPIGPGLWYHSADADRSLFPYWGSVRTFVIAPEETTTVPPIEYSEDTNSLYFADMKECYVESNAAKAEDGEQLWIAEFWSDDVEGMMFSPPARQYSLSNQLIKKFDSDLAETLTMYLKIGFALNDAAVATWKYKYQYNVMRPNNYIHEFIDPDFQTNLYTLVWWPNPGFPGYPSGHSTFASAAAGVFIDYFGNNINFTDRSHEGRTEFRGKPRTFRSMKEMAAENAFSRIPLGVHMRMDCTEGLRLGYEISDAVNELNFRANTNLANN